VAVAAAALPVDVSPAVVAAEVDVEAVKAAKADAKVVVAAKVAAADVVVAAEAEEETKEGVLPAPKPVSRF